MSALTGMLSLVLLLLGVLAAVAIPAEEITADHELLKAAFDNDLEGVKQALADGADPNIKLDSSGQTALMGATLRGHAPVVEYMLQVNGVDVRIPEKDGYTPAHGAGFQGQYEVLKLLHAAGINIKDDFHSDGFAPVHRSCWGRARKHTKTLRVFADLGVDLTMPAKNGKTCMEMTKNPDTIKLLKELYPEQHMEL